MGRPRISEERRIATAVRLPESLHRRLQVAASERDVSANLLATKAIDDYLTRLPSAADDLAPGRPRPSKRAAS
jgi:predicted transcriptional regulator